jgi:hypothetical protein
MDSIKRTRVFWYFWKAYFTEHKRVKLKLHFRGKTYLVDKVQCNVSCNSRTRKRNPVVVMEAKALGVSFITKKINGYKITTAYIC